ncbi:MAG: hypothetical protein KatS3mg028_1264 [Bacteroidia bacterium]|nr:MAG: hypothetical protein KatS3mg028_1264 [Bacteroidia bacterium]
MKKIYFAIIVSAQTAVLLSQNNPKTFSLKEAVEYALTHNYNYLSAQTEVKSAKARNWEYTGIGLPQVSASFDLKDYLELPTSLLPGPILSAAAPGTYVPVQLRNAIQRHRRASRSPKSYSAPITSLPCKHPKILLNSLKKIFKEQK